MTLPTKLEREIMDIIKSVEGTFGIVIKILDTGDEIDINGEEIFPAASIIKIPILVEAFRQNLEGRIKLDEPITLRNEDKVGGMGILKELSPGIQLPFIDILTLMIIISDNTATNITIEKVGMKNVNEYMKQLGLKNTILQRKMMDLEARKRGLENLTTPRDMTILLQKIFEKTILDNKSCEKILDILKRQQVNDRIPKYLPENIPIAHKTGELPGVRHDVGIIYTEKHPYIISAMTKNLKDPLSQKTSGGAGSEAIAKISKIVYDTLTST
ncbi:MAG: class A beta-lactamase-related serine hydrolase [Candidatus Verstraetearchaeota archaeon]|nr:class A beta-lactamase-related serine hydrolase [Candidatus Verstraetearchaeota archaeon]